jgi:hypothetical protein
VLIAVILVGYVKIISGEKHILANVAEQVNLVDVTQQIHLGTLTSPPTKEGRDEIRNRQSL